VNYKVFQKSLLFSVGHIYLKEVKDFWNTLYIYLA
jgi:hypothetical protein